MKRLISLALAVSIILFPLFAYTYVRGCKDGVMRYQKSDRFTLTLYSMYKFGLAEGIASCKGEK
jgi:hypothetical protein